MTGPAEKSIVVRAFELAPQCSSTKELRKALAREGYTQIDAHLSGLGIKRELQRFYIRAPD